MIGSRLRLLLAALAAVSLCAAGQAAELALDEHGGPVKGVAVSADGRRALSASFDYSIILWDLPRRAVQARLHGHEAAVNDVAFLPGERALSASDDGTLGLWDLAAGRLIRSLEGHAGKVAALAIAPDGRRAASAGWDRTVRLWDLADGTMVRVFEAGENLNAVRFSSDGARLYAGGSEGTMLAWRVADGARLMAEGWHDFGITALDLTADGRLGATASIDETVQLWELASGARAATLYGHIGPVLAVAFSPDGSLVASGGIDGTVRVWRRGDGDRLRVYERHHGPVWDVAFMADGTTLVSAGADGLVLTHDLRREADDDADPAPAPVAAVADDGSRGAELFRTCVACHTVTPDGGHRAGPTLYRVFGRTAGAEPGYPYSAALRDSDIVWTEETVARLFEVGPDQLVPGSKMPLQRMPSAADRRELIGYLKRVTQPHD